MGIPRSLNFGCVRADNWSVKAIRRKTTGTGRMRYLKTVNRRFKNGFREGACMPAPTVSAFALLCGATPPVGLCSLCNQPDVYAELSLWGLPGGDWGLAWLGVNPVESEHMHLLIESQPVLIWGGLSSAGVTAPAKHATPSA